MSTLQELIQYVEKEIQAKRFLTEALSDLTALESLEETQRTMEAAVDNLKADLAKAQSDLVDVNYNIDTAKEVLADTQDEAKKTEEDAKGIAADLITEAKVTAKKLVADAQAQVDAKDEVIAELEASISKLQDEYKSVATDVENINAEKAKLLEKLGA